MFAKWLCVRLPLIEALEVATVDPVSIALILVTTFFLLLSLQSFVHVFVLIS